MKRKLDIWGILNVAAWLLFFALFAVGLLSYNKIQETLDEASLVSAQRNSQLDAIGAAMRENRQFMQQQVDQSIFIDELCAMQRRSGDDRLAAYCANFRQFLQLDFVPLLIIETKAASERARGKFEDSIKFYKQARETLRGISDKYGAPDQVNLRQMTLLEGQAYGLYRLGRLEEAASVIDQALALEKPGGTEITGFVYSTSMKINCAADIPSYDAASLHAKYLNRLQDALERDQTSLAENDQDYRINYLTFWVQYRDEDLEDFLADEELKIVCGL